MAALRLLSRKAVQPLAQRAGLLSTRQVAPMMSSFSVRTNATSARADPKDKATALINLFPGESLAAKSGSVLVASSIAAYLISKEIYIVDAEFFEMFCIFGAYYLWYKGAGVGLGEYVKERKETIKRVLTEARDEHKAVVKERMAHIGKMSDVVDVTNNLYGMSKEIAQMEAQVYELKQRVEYTQQVKSVLDSWVRHESSVREKEQKQLVSHVIEKVKASLSSPKMYNEILNQTLGDVEKLAKRA